MINRFHLVDAIVLCLIWMTFLPSAALAYFDLGTGTYLVQLLFAFAATAWFTLRKVFVAKPKFLTTKKAPAAEEPATNPAAADSGEVSN